MVDKTKMLGVIQKAVMKFTFQNGKSSSKLNLQTIMYQTGIANLKIFRNLKMKSLLMTQAHLLIRVKNG